MGCREFDGWVVQETESGDAIGEIGGEEGNFFPKRDG